MYLNGMRKGLKMLTIIEFKLQLIIIKIYYIHIHYYKIYT